MHMSKLMQPKSRGVTPMETLIVLVLGISILLVAVPFLYQMLHSYRTTGSSSQLALAIRFARNACVKNKYPYRIAIHDKTHSTKPNTYEILSDQDDNGSFETSELHRLENSIVIDDGGTNVDEIEFNTRGISWDPGVSPVSAPFNILLENQAFTQMKCQVSVTAIGGVAVNKIGNW